MLRLPIHGLDEAIRDHNCHFINLDGRICKVLLGLCHRSGRGLTSSLGTAFLFLLSHRG